MTPTSDRFWSKVTGGDVSTCWEWQAAQNKGYGVFRLERTVIAHRYAYEQMVGPIPAGLHLDHVCRNHSCVNPWHLEPVTSGVNTRRGTHCRATAQQCANGHPWTPKTLKSYRGVRYCGECSRIHTARCRARRKRAA